MGDLEEITQKFVADVTQYVAEMQAAAGDAQKFAAANEEAKTAVKGLRDSAAEAALPVAEMRNRLTEVAAAAGITRDEMGKLRDAQGKLVGDSVLTGLALGHERDEALEAAAAFKKLRDAVAEADIAKSGGGLLSKLGGLFGGGGAASGIPLIGSLAESPQLLLAIVPAIMAAVTEVGALATGATAAGLGLGSIAALAVPAFKDIEGQYQKLNAAQQKYQQAVALEKLDPTKAHAAAVKAALDQVNLVGQAYQKLPAQEQGAVDGIYKLTQAFQAQAKAFEPTAFKLFNEGLKIANQLLPYVSQFANAAAPAVEGLLTSFSKGLDSPAFKQFTGFLESLSGPVITAVGSGMAGLGKDVATLMEQFSKKDVVNSVNIAFRLLGFTLTALTWIIKISMGAWDLLTKAIHLTAAAFDLVRHAAATAGHDIASAFDTARHAAAAFGHDTASAFDTVRHALATWGHDVATAFDVVRHAAAAAGDDIVRPLVAAYDWVVRNWKNIAAWLLLPIPMAVFEIRTHLKEIEQAFTQLGHDIAAIFDGARHDIAAIAVGIVHDTEAQFTAARHEAAVIFDGLRHDIAAIVVGIPGDIRKAWDTIRHDAAALGDDVLHDVESLWHNVTSATSSGASQTAGFFQKLPGQVLGFLKSLPGDMLSIGENIITGLYNGIVKQFNAVIGEVKNLAHDISSAFTNPLSIFSPSRVFFEHGANIVRGAINGIKAYAPQLTAAVRGLGTGAGAQGLGSAYAAGAVGPGGGSTTHVTVPVTVQAGAAGAVSPQYLQGLGSAVQEAVLRYNQLNPGNGLNVAWGR